MKCASVKRVRGHANSFVLVKAKGNRERGFNIVFSF